MKSLLIFLLLMVVYVSPAYASSYTNWLTNFERKLKVGPNLDKDEIRDIEDELSVRPDGEGRDYVSWMRLFSEKIEVGPVLDKDESIVINYVLQAKPQRNSIYYPDFLAVLAEYINNVSAILGEDKQKILGFILQAQTEAATGLDYDEFKSQWQDSYQRLKLKFGNLDKVEQQLLDFFKKAQPMKSQLTYNDPLYKQWQAILVNDASSLAEALSANDYALADKFVDIVELFSSRLNKEAKSDPNLKRLSSRLNEL